MFAISIVRTNRIAIPDIVGMIGRENIESNMNMNMSVSSFAP